MRGKRRQADHQLEHADRVVLGVPWLCGHAELRMLGERLYVAAAKPAISRFWLASRDWGRHPSGVMSQARNGP